MNDLGLDRTAAAMLMVESDMPGVAATDELERAEAACRARRRDRRRPRRRRAGGRLAAPGAAGRPLRARAARRGPDGGRRRAALARARTCSARSSAIAAKHDVRIGTFGHAGDGNLHPDLVFERGDPQAEAMTDAVRADLYRAALALGGTVTGEHGIGSARAGVARDPARRRRGPGHARDQDRARPAGHPQPGARRLRIAATCRGTAGRACGRGRVAVQAARPVSRPDCAEPRCCRQQRKPGFVAPHGAAHSPPARSAHHCRALTDGPSRPGFVGRGL